MFPDAPTTQVISGTAPAPTTGPTGTDTTHPGAATSAATAGTDADAADAARGDADALTRALDEGDYTALAQAVSERVAPHAGGGAYATALVDALGARALVRVAAHLPTGTTTTWTSLLATATASPLWTDEHREALARDLTSLVTVTGDVAEPDALLLPAGFMRLLTADQDPLTAAAGTQTSDSEDVRDPLALDAGFLASLVHGLMAGETGAAAGGSRVGWVEYARLTTTAGGGYVNFPEGTPQDMTTHRASYDPLPAVLTATARTPTTVLDILAPPLPGPDPSTPPSEEDEFRRILATQVDGSLWAWVAARTQKAGPAYLEALTAAVASASTLRYRPTTSQPNPYEAQAAWLTEQATTALAGVDTTTWTPTARRTTAVTLANSVGDLWDAARDDVHFYLFQTFYNSLPTGWSKHHNEELTTLLREVLKDDTALTTVSRAAGVFTAHHLTAVAKDIEPGTRLDVSYATLLHETSLDSSLYGYLYTACATGRGIGADEASTATGILLNTMLQSLTPIPGASWHPPADPANQDATDTSGVDRVAVQEFQAVLDGRLRFEIIGILDSTHLIPQEDYQGRYPDVFQWIIRDSDGVWHLDWNTAIANKYDLNTWFQVVWRTHNFGAECISPTYVAFEYGSQEAHEPVPATTPRSPARHAALVVALTTATTLLVYNFSHTHQRRREKRRRRWYEEEYRGGPVS
ncbi:hypothetical protein [Actinomyces sp. HMT897]|uniref:DUF6571 family protein n=1 Tax=Actinomyces sp. HMT897 TaxID=2789424 RepID=UPI0019094B65|nr:hypothetical protein [Actinomyces sp. HMT897]QQO77614.1 hypothetical protein JJJ15_11510 [Actinomyces sp. HMT897]